MVELTHRVYAKESDLLRAWPICDAWLIKARQTFYENYPGVGGKIQPSLFVTIDRVNGPSASIDF